MELSVCQSLPARGAWIEIRADHGNAAQQWSLPARGAWIEIITIAQKTLARIKSLPARGAWIEMAIALTSKEEINVAPRKGSVD